MYAFKPTTSTSQAPVSENYLQPIHLTGQSKGPTSQKQQHNKLTQTKNSFTPLQCHAKSQYQANNRELTCSNCSNTIHRPCFNFPAKRYQYKNCKKCGHFTSECFNLRTKKAQANLYLVDTQEVDHLFSLNQSPNAIQSIMLPRYIYHP